MLNLEKIAQEAYTDEMQKLALSQGTILKAVSKKIDKVAPREGSKWAGTAKKILESQSKRDLSRPYLKNLVKQYKKV